ncbi:CHASE2 domain-containing protein [Trichocoleus sp. FACHB-46]|uniref:CHASE2 domain-containing protein n=1 Tax=Trichocoleus desertorum GB2-A4 TaxID=2933944 RepID=A0ABV0JC11_9CYAN|nr:CHASE2 domain-containing protein [Trichocoleus sp. FACHB-46]MBD1865452.1 CHASE2 domain-containing protein [Trichocoleus sp. FACHB-46]
MSDRVYPMWTILKQFIWRWRGVLVTAPSIAGGLLILRFAGALQLLELAALDQMFRLRHFEPADPRIVLVTVDESDIKQLGRWPMSDAVLAQLILSIKQQQPRVIGLDIFRDLPVEPGHQDLINVFISTPNLIGIEKVIQTAQGEVIQAPPALKRRDQVSAIDLLLDIDGTIRRSLLYLSNKDGRAIATLGAQLAFVYLRGEGIELETIDSSQGQFRLGRAAFTSLRSNDGGYVGVDAGGYQILSNFPKFLNDFHTISMTDVLRGRIPKNLMRDRIVLIGLTAESIEDKFFISYTTDLIAAPPGVAVHALLTSQLLSAALEGRPLLSVWPEPLEWLWIIFWSAIGAVIGRISRSPRQTAFRVVLLGIVLLGSAYGLFLAGWWIIIIPPLLALAASAITSSSYLLWDNLKEYARTLEQRVEERTLKLEQEIAERKQAEATLSQQKQLLQAIVEHIPVMITLYDAEGEIEFVNHQFEQTLGWSTADLHHIDLIAECCFNSEQQQILDHMLAATGTWSDLKIRTKDERVVNTAWANIRLPNGMNVGIGQDISDRKRAEAASILEERNRMAREIHDTLAQAFTGILLHVGAATEIMTRKAEAAQAHLETVDELARTGLAEARRSVAALRPKLLEEGDLFSALKHLVNQMKSSTKTQITCQIMGGVYALPPDVENNLLRIGQEALTNAIKYAQATEIWVELVYEETQCLLRVKDDGQGFEVDQVYLTKGFGLLGMSERVDQIGAELIIHSQPAQGTEIIVVVNRE